MDLFMEPELLFTPDNDWSYSNSGFTLAGMIVEKISGQSFPEYMQEHIFQPAGMQHTYIGNLNQVFPKKYPDIHPRIWLDTRKRIQLGLAICRRGHHLFSGRSAIVG